MTDEEIVTLKRLLSKAVSEIVDALRVPGVYNTPIDNPARRTEGRLLGLKETAERLNIPLQRAYALARENMIPVVRFGRQIRVPSDKLEEFIRNGGKALSGGWKR